MASIRVAQGPASLPVQVHFDCMYKGIDVVSSRQARLLGGNRTISEVRSTFRGNQPCTGLPKAFHPVPDCSSRACAQLTPAWCLQPIEFVAGGQVAGAPVKKITDTAGGLFAGSGGPKPPPALSSAVLGMRTGGKVHSAASGPSVVDLPALHLSCTTQRSAAFASCKA